jgi:polysaccharide biosynthesis transport protein
LLSLLLELRDKGFRTSAQVQQLIGPLTVSATPRAVGRQRRSPADIILSDNRSAFAEAFRIFWANIQLAVAGPTPASAGRRGLGTALGITSAATGDGKSVHALGLARTAALAGENVVLVDADLRRSGVSRLLDQDFCLTLGDFLQDRCTANDVVAIEERSGVHFVPSAPTNAPWTNREFQRFFNLIDYLKNRFAIVIVDLPPILGLAETIRLAMAVDSLAFVVRWGRTERHLVQSALDSLRTANTSTVAVVLNDIDLKAQRRRGYRDHTLIYSDAELYRTPTGYREPVTPAPSSTVSMAAAGPDAGSEETDRSEPQTDDAPRIGPRTAGSAIERWYDQYRG